MTIPGKDSGKHMPLELSKLLLKEIIKNGNER